MAKLAGLKGFRTKMDRGSVEKAARCSSFRFCSVLDPDPDRYYNEHGSETQLSCLLFTFHWIIRGLPSEMITISLA
jgi:hypothetical protein